MPRTTAMRSQLFFILAKFSSIGGGGRYEDSLSGDFYLIGDPVAPLTFAKLRGDLL